MTRLGLKDKDGGSRRDAAAVKQWSAYLRKYVRLFVRSDEVGNVMEAVR